MEYYIRRVLINGLFDKGNDYKIDLSSGCNCIYGGNGTGKTTIINLIVNSLNVELDAIGQIPFESISIRLSKQGQTRPQKFFTLTRIVGDEKRRPDVIKLKYEVGEESFIFTLRRNEPSERSMDRFSESISKLKHQLLDKVNLTHVPLLRMHDSELYIGRDDYLQSMLRHHKVSNAQISEIIDPSVRVLNSLQRQFIKEANENRIKITEKLEGLKSQIIEKVMIDKKIVSGVSKSFNKVGKAIVDEIADFDVTAYKEKLNGANINVPDVKIHEHFDEWKRLNSSVKSSFEKLQTIRDNKMASEEEKAKCSDKFNTSYYALFAMTHFHERFLSVVEDVEKMQEETSELTKSFRDYEEEVNWYLSGKKSFELSDSGKFYVKSVSNGRSIPLSELSSGEKHILSILGRAALSGNDGAVFVADEPELSLHLDWQRKILPSIIKLSPKSQIIVATHSPAVHAKGATEIDLEECV